jgi:hypothetical protein
MTQPKSTSTNERERLRDAALASEEHVEEQIEEESVEAEARANERMPDK